MMFHKYDGSYLFIDGYGARFELTPTGDPDMPITITRLSFAEGFPIPALTNEPDAPLATNTLPHYTIRCAGCGHVAGKCVCMVAPYDIVDEVSGRLV